MTMRDDWQIITLGDVSETALGKMLDKGRDRGHPRVPYLRNINVQWGRVDTSDIATMELQEDQRERFAVETGDLLVCEGGEIGRAAIWRGRSDYIAYQKALHRVRPTALVESRFLLHLLALYAGNGTLARHATGSTIAHLPQESLRRLPVPLPPIAEQRRIVEILEDHLSRLEAAEQIMSQVQGRVKGLRQARHVETFRQLSPRARVRPLLDVVAIANGQTPKGLLDKVHEVDDSDSVPYYKVGDMNLADGRTMGHSRSFISRRDAQAFGLHVRPPGTVLIPKRGGAIATNKKRLLASEAAYDLNTMGLVPTRDLLPEYLWHWLSGVDLGRLADGSNVPQINSPQIARLSLPVPSLTAQAEAIAQLDQLDEETSRLSLSVAGAGARCTALRQVLLAAAFSGNLSGVRHDDALIEEMANV